MKLTHESAEFYIGKLTIALYWPCIEASKIKVHISFPSKIIYRDRNDWAWNKSIAILLFGFGVGIAHNHCDNPNYEQPTEGSA